MIVSYHRDRVQIVVANFIKGDKKTISSPRRTGREMQVQII